ncbi:MAG: FAD-containing monooxygenase EthA [Acidimicrobiales bacterium mtb01]|nr:NAD(P)/FAD-dependent oxidoreductase [Actinomycetota bacterium]TEX45676.1 MAG: FAD-containing monooxygenase EthA [Acidimicrobiales bacterium mtb01]
MSQVEDDGQALIEHVDVLIVGAGISGIGAAAHLTEQLPDLSFVILERYDTFGGTWHLHRYPGVRSDSDLFTFGYRFKPWVGAPIASGQEILRYLEEVVEERDLAPHIRYSHHVSDARWESNDNLWHVRATREGSETPLHFTARFLWMCQGYYHHDVGYTPEWSGTSDFEGQIVHPQHWPDGMSWTDKRIIVIGSGATAATVIPAIAADSAHVVMLQRSPTYFVSDRNGNDLAELLVSLDVPPEWIHEIVRRKIIADADTFTRKAFADPEGTARSLIENVRSLLPEGYDVETHFTPKYMPWRQRVAFVPDGDLFKAISSGKVEVVTDEVETFTATGVRTRSGRDLDADVVITATGFDLSVLGGVRFVVDGQPVDFAETVSYRGMMFTDVPNLAWVFGYFRSSWTLRADLVADLVCRLLMHMREKGAARVIPRLRPADEGLSRLDWIDPADFSPGYLKRSMHLMPKRLDTPEWRHTQDYVAERTALPNADLDDGCLEFT